MRPQECNNCEFSTGDGKDWTINGDKGRWGLSMQCRRFPPVVLEKEKCGDFSWGQPWVLGADWCGEWKEKVSPVGKKQ